MSNTIHVRIQRQDSPDGPSRWEEFQVERQRNMNVISVLQAIAANPVTADGKPTTPVAYDCNCLEEVCGACTMIINGRVRQACSALVDKLLEEAPILTLQPMTKFPTQRDLYPDRSSMFESLIRLKGWVPIDGTYHLGPGPKLDPQVADERYAYSRCMTCGCCMEACPQFNDRSRFIGPAPIAQAVLFNQHPTGAVLTDDRLEVLKGPGGVSECGNAQNCVKVCPKEVPLLRGIATAGRQVVRYAIRKWFNS